MIIEQITLEGFLSYKKRQVITFPSVPICLVNGSIDSDTSLSNGAGKSGLFEAIPVCLFGRIGGRAETLDNYINDSMNFLYIELIYLVDNVRYRTIFSRNRGASTKQEFHVDSNKGIIEDAKWKLIDKKAEEILGVSFLTYSSTIYLNERDALKFIDGESGDRKEILRELLNAEVYEKALDETKKKLDDVSKQIDINSTLIQSKQTQLVDEKIINEEINEAKKEIKKIELKMKENDSRLKELDKNKSALELEIEKQKITLERITQIEEEIETIESSCRSLKIKNENLIEKKDDCKETITNNENLLSSLKKKKVVLTKTITNQKDELSSKDDFEKKLKEITEYIQTTNKSLVISEQLKSKTQTEISQLNLLINKIKKFEAVCPITELECSILDSSYKDKFESEKTEKRDELVLILDGCKEKIEKIEIDLEHKSSEQEKLLDLIEKKNNLKSQISENEKSLIDIESKEKTYIFKNEEYEKQIIASEKDIKENLDSIQKLESKIVDSKKKIDVLKISINQETKIELIKVKDSISLIKNDIENLLFEIKSSEKIISVNENKIELNKTILKHIAELQKSNIDLTRRKRIFLTLVSTFGKEGIQKAIISQAIPFLEQSATDLLKIFNNDSEKIKIKFDLDPKRSDGELKKRGGLDILVVEADKPPKDLRMYSGGERVRLIFSIILGLTKLLTRRSGKKHETLIIDEKIAKLDRKGIDQFVEVIDIISKWYRNIYIITHIESLKEIFDNEIVVNKTESEGSIVQID
jgi:DNA repair exonuclease SbcCD ATPase subunit